MIKRLENIDKLENKQEEMKSFIKKVSPFTEQNPRLNYLVDRFLQDIEMPVLIMMNETVIDPFTKINKIKHFMTWVTSNNLYTGTAFIPEFEISKGVNFSDYEDAD